MNRIGIGYDIHPLVPGRLLVLGGLHIPFDKGLDGHSDADVLVHAIADAILGALGLGDIGHFFPNTDPRWRNISSLVFLQQIQEFLANQNASIENIDATLIAEAPKIVPHIAAMKEKLSAALATTPERINLKATTNEKLGSIGRGEGIAAMAVACITVSAKKDVLL